MKKIELSLILPCYNEAEHFGSSVKKIIWELKKLETSFEVIFVEDKSSDDTKLLVKKFVQKQKIPTIKALYHSQNLGRGAAVKSGIHNAQGAYVGYIDIDCEVSPKYMSEFLSKLRSGNDCVYGVRHYKWIRGGFIRALVSYGYSFLVKHILGTQVKDTEAGFKFFNRKKIVPLLNKTTDAGWFWDTEVMIISEKNGLTLSSVPVIFNRRTDKTSTVNLCKDTIDYLRKLLIFRLRTY